MIIFYSGSCGVVKDKGLIGEPEIVLPPPPRRFIMLSYYLVANNHQDQKQRFKKYRKVKSK